MEDYQDRLRIATPEGISVDLVLAGLGSRFTAASVDLVLKVVLMIGGFVAGALVDGDLGLAVISISTFVIYFGYDIAFEVLAGGRTPGKRWTGLRVLRDDGRPVDLLSSAIRNIVRLVDGLPLLYFPAMVSVLVTRRNQRLGDLAAATIVIREERPAKAPKRRKPSQWDHLAGPAYPQAPTFGGFAMPVQAPGGPGAGAGSGAGRATALAALDVSAVTPADLAAVRGFLERRDALSASVRQDLARRIAGALAPRVGGATGQLRDEELIEQVALAKGRGG
jgi:uncharacterized RDD family membrane protein YckC